MKSSVSKVVERYRSASSFSEEDLAVMVIFYSLKPAGRGRVLEGAGLGEYKPSNPHIKSLIDKGIIKLRGNSMMLDRSKAQGIMKQHPVPPKYEDSLGLTNPHSKFKKASDEYLTVEEVADVCLKCAFEMITAGVHGAYRSDLNRMIEAAKWGKLPKGWTQESVKKFWNSLTGDRKHKVTACIKKMEGSEIDDTGAFCASLADKMEPGWRSRDAAKKKTFPQARKEILDHLRKEGWQVNDKLKVPWAKDPDKDIQIWFKSQAVYGVGGLDGGRQKANFGAARSIHTDIRDVTPEEFVKDVKRWFKE